jgi:hypothetical protein
MAPYEFEELVDSKVPGITLRSKKDTGTPETGVYLPPAHQPKTLNLNVLLWLHGFFVRDIENLFRPKADQDPRVRQSVLASGEDVILVAPHLGWVKSDYSGKDGYGAGRLGVGTGCEDYLLRVLAGLGLYLKARFGAQGPHGKLDIDKAMQTNPNWLRDGPPAHRLDIDRLYVACHSGGGYGAMIPLVNALGRFKAPVLRQCWAFDCLYPADWLSFCRSHQDVDLYFYYGQGTMGPGAREVIFQLSQVAYGTPARPQPAFARRVFLAPAFAGVENDRVAFQSPDRIQEQLKPATRYEQIRKKLDPLLNNGRKYWQTFDEDKDGPELKDHFDVPADLLTPRIKDAMSRPEG